MTTRLLIAILLSDCSSNRHADYTEPAQRKNETSEKVLGIEVYVVYDCNSQVSPFFTHVSVVSLYVAVHDVDDMMCTFMFTGVSPL